MGNNESSINEMEIGPAAQRPMNSEFNSLFS